MGFASKIAASQNSMAKNTYGGAPPTGYTGGPPGAPPTPAALRPGGYQQQNQYQAYPGSPAPQASNQPQAPYPGAQAPGGPSPGTPAGQYGAPPPAQYGAPGGAQGRPGPSPGAPGGQYGAPAGAQGRPGPSPGTPAGQYGAPPPGQYGTPGVAPGGPGPSPGTPGGQYGAPPGQYGAPGGVQGRPGPSPGPGQYGAPPGQYGAPGGAPPSQPAAPHMIEAYRQLLIGTIQEKHLQAFYPPDRLEQLVQSLGRDAPGKLDRLISEWRVPMEVATDVMKLALFDVILYVDDSGSIEFEEKGLRKEQLRQILGIVASAASTFDEDGISVRFMNSSEQGDGIRNANDVNNLVSRVRFSGLTPLGTGLKNKVIDPMIVAPARANRLEKPVLVITITDGQPAGEAHSAVHSAIRHAVDEVSRTRYGRGAVSFQFSQVGNDQRARDFLGELDEDPQIGGLIDCTSNFEVEQDEMSRAIPPVDLTRELWCAKLMLGAIDSSYDTKDEKAAGRAAAGGAPPPSAPYGSYNQPPGGQPAYNAPQGGYNAQPGSQPGWQAGPPQQQAPGQYGQQPQQGYGYGGPSPQQPTGGYPPPPRRY